MPTISEALAIAVQHHQAGRLAEAEQVYRQVLAIKPNQPTAWHLLGVIAHQVGRNGIAVEYIERAIQSNENVAEFHNNLGEAKRALEKFEEAAACYQRALRLNPDFAEAHNNLGIIRLGREDLTEARACFQRAVQLKPDFAEAHNNLGFALLRQGEPAQARACFERAVQLNPRYVEAYHNLGNVWSDQGRLEEAAACYERAMQLKPDFAEAHNSLGIILKNQGRLDEAVACYQRALELKPDFFEVLNNLGIIRKNQGRVEEAVACYQRALQLNPDFAEVHNNLGTVWKSCGKWDDAVASFQRALELKPDFTAALSSLVAAMQRICQWDGLIPLAERVIEAVEKGDDAAQADPVSPFAFLSLPTATTARQQLRCARQWASWTLKRFVEQGNWRSDASGPSATADRLTSASSVESKAGLQCKPRLTVGYLSADFRSHPMSYTIVELLEKHDRGRFTVCGYSYGPDDGSPIRKRIATACDKFVDLTETTYVQSAERIAADEVDILVDLAGYTLYARTEILALRPAPLQVHYWGYPGTLGAEFIDYNLVDEFVVPAGQEPYFTEKLVRLPGCYVPSDSQCEVAPNTPSKSECGLPDEGFVFCCFNASNKYTPQVFDVWMDVLKAVPGSVLWLLEGNPSVPANLRKEAAIRGVAPERLVFAPWRPPPEYLARHRLADLFLDTFPYTAHTTARDALWMGCPVLTRTGETFASRVAGSLLRTIGLPVLITTSALEYRDLAVQMARDTDRLADVRARLSASRKTSPLFQGASIARNFEKAFEKMWETHASGQPPRTFSVGH